MIKNEEYRIFRTKLKDKYNQFLYLENEAFRIAQAFRRE